MATSEESCDSNPNFAIICSFIAKFGDDCGVKVTIPALQQMLEDTKNAIPEELKEIHIHLLRKGKKRVNKEKWERSLIKFCHEYSSVDAWELERFGYKKAKLSVKLEILKRLFELQFDSNAKFKAEVNKHDATVLRVLPIGRDIQGSMYWYQLDADCNMRLYRQDANDDHTWHLLCSTKESLADLLLALGKQSVKGQDIISQIIKSSSLTEKVPLEDDVERDIKKEMGESTDDLTSSLSPNKPCAIIIKTEKKEPISTSLNEENRTLDHKVEKPCEVSPSSLQTPTISVPEQTSSSCENDHRTLKEESVEISCKAQCSTSKTAELESCTIAESPCMLSVSKDDAELSRCTASTDATTVCTDLKPTISQGEDNSSCNSEGTTVIQDLKPSQSTERKLENNQGPSISETPMDVDVHSVSESHDKRQGFRDNNNQTPQLESQQVPDPKFNNQFHRTTEFADLKFKKSKVKLYQKWNDEKKKSLSCPPINHPLAKLSQTCDLSLKPTSNLMMKFVGSDDEAMKPMDLSSPTKENVTLKSVISSNYTAPLSFAHCAEVPMDLSRPSVVKSSDCSATDKFPVLAPGVDHSIQRAKQSKEQWKPKTMDLSNDPSSRTNSRKLTHSADSILCRPVKRKHLMPESIVGNPEQSRHSVICEVKRSAKGEENHSLIPSSNIHSVHQNVPIVIPPEVSEYKHILSRSDACQNSANLSPPPMTKSYESQKICKNAAQSDSCKPTKCENKVDKCQTQSIVKQSSPESSPPKDLSRISSKDKAEAVACVSMSSSEAHQADNSDICDNKTEEVSVLKVSVKSPDEIKESIEKVSEVTHNSEQLFQPHCTKDSVSGEEKTPENSSNTKDFPVHRNDESTLSKQVSELSDASGVESVDAACKSDAEKKHSGSKSIQPSSLVEKDDTPISKSENSVLIRPSISKCNNESVLSTHLVKTQCTENANSGEQLKKTSEKLSQGLSGETQGSCSKDVSGGSSIRSASPSEKSDFRGACASSLKLPRNSETDLQKAESKNDICITVNQNESKTVSSDVIAVDRPKSKKAPMENSPVFLKDEGSLLCESSKNKGELSPKQVDGPDHSVDTGDKSQMKNSAPCVESSKPVALSDVEKSLDHSPKVKVTDVEKPEITTDDKQTVKEVFRKMKLVEKDSPNDHSKSVDNSISDKASSTISQEKGNDASQLMENADKGVDCADKDVDCADKDVDCANKDVDCADKGVDCADKGVDCANKGVDCADKGVDCSSVNETDAGSDDKKELRSISLECDSEPKLKKAEVPQNSDSEHALNAGNRINASISDGKLADTKPENELLFNTDSDATSEVIQSSDTLDAKNKSTVSDKNVQGEVSTTTNDKSPTRNLELKAVDSDSQKEDHPLEEKGKDNVESEKNTESVEKLSLSDDKEELMVSDRSLEVPVMNVEEGERVPESAKVVDDVATSTQNEVLDGPRSGDSKQADTNCKTEILKSLEKPMPSDKDEKHDPIPDVLEASKPASTKENARSEVTKAVASEQSASSKEQESSLKTTKEVENTEKIKPCVLSVSEILTSEASHDLKVENSRNQSTENKYESESISPVEIENIEEMPGKVDQSLPTVKDAEGDQPDIPDKLEVSLSEEDGTKQSNITLVSSSKSDLTDKNEKPLTDHSQEELKEPVTELLKSSSTSPPAKQSSSSKSLTSDISDGTKTSRKQKISTSEMHIDGENKTDEKTKKLEHQTNDDQAEKILDDQDFTTSVSNDITDSKLDVLKESIVDAKDKSSLENASEERKSPSLEKADGQEKQELCALKTDENLEDVPTKENLKPETIMNCSESNNQESDGKKNSEISQKQEHELPKTDENSDVPTIEDLKPETIVSCSESNYQESDGKKPSKISQCGNQNKRNKISIEENDTVKGGNDLATVTDKDGDDHHVSTETESEKTKLKDEDQELGIEAVVEDSKSSSKLESKKLPKGKRGAQRRGKRGKRTGVSKGENGKTSPMETENNEDNSENCDKSNTTVAEQSSERTLDSIENLAEPNGNAKHVDLGKNETLSKREDESVKCSENNANIQIRAFSVVVTKENCSSLDGEIIKSSEVDLCNKSSVKRRTRRGADKKLLDEIKEQPLEPKTDRKTAPKATTPESRSVTSAFKFDYFDEEATNVVLTESGKDGVSHEQKVLKYSHLYSIYIPSICRETKFAYETSEFRCNNYGFKLKHMERLDSLSLPVQLSSPIKKSLVKPRRGNAKAKARQSQPIADDFQREEDMYFELPCPTPSRRGKRSRGRGRRAPRPSSASKKADLASARGRGRAKSARQRGGSVRGRANPQKNASEFHLPEGFFEILDDSKDKDKTSDEDASKTSGRRGAQDRSSLPDSESESHQSSGPRKRSRRIQEQHQKKISELAVEMHNEHRRLEQLAKKNTTPNKKRNSKVNEPKVAAKSIFDEPIIEDACLEGKPGGRKRRLRAVNMAKLALLYDEESKDSEHSTSRSTEKSRKRRGTRGKRRGYKPWDLSSESTTTVEELTEEEEDEEEPEEQLVFNANEDEFACEEIEEDAEPVVVRRARTAKKVPEGENECEYIVDDKPCSKCGKFDRPEWILLCDQCNDGYHMSCLVPQLFTIPDGDWFCQPCEHLFLCQCLNEELHKLEVLLKQKEREELRKQRLAYVGISLDNVLKPDKKESGSGSEVMSEADEKKVEVKKRVVDDDLKKKVFGKRSSRARRNVNYQFKEYDELIASAIGDELLEDFKLEEFAEPEVQEKESEDDDSYKGPTPAKRKRIRKLNDLDFSDDDDSGDDYKGLSTDTEHTPSANTEVSQSGSDAASGEWRIVKTRPRVRKRRPGRGRRGKYSTSEEEDFESDASSYRPSTRRVAQKQISYRELSSEEEWSEIPKKKTPKRKKKDTSSDDTSEVSFKSDQSLKPAKKARSSKKWEESSSESEENTDNDSSESEAEDSESTRQSAGEWKIEKSSDGGRIKLNINKKVIDSDNSEASEKKVKPKKRLNRVISDSEEEEDDDDDEEDDDDSSSESSDNSGSESSESAVPQKKVVDVKRTENTAVSPKSKVDEQSKVKVVQQKTVANSVPPKDLKSKPKVPVNTSKAPVDKPKVVAKPSKPLESIQKVASAAVSKAAPDKPATTTVTPVRVSQIPPNVAAVCRAVANSHHGGSSSQIVVQTVVVKTVPKGTIKEIKMVPSKIQYKDKIDGNESDSKKSTSNVKELPKQELPPVSSKAVASPKVPVTKSIASNVKTTSQKDQTMPIGPIQQQRSFLNSPIPPQSGAPLRPPVMGSKNNQPPQAFPSSMIRPPSMPMAQHSFRGTHPSQRFAMEAQIRPMLQMPPSVRNSLSAQQMYAASPSEVRPNVPMKGMPLRANVLPPSSYSSPPLEPLSNSSVRPPQLPLAKSGPPPQPYSGSIVEPFSGADIDQGSDSREEVPLEQIPCDTENPTYVCKSAPYEKENEYRPAKEAANYPYNMQEEKGFPSTYSPLSSLQEFTSRPSPLKPSLVETYPSNASPTRLTPLDSYPQSSSPKGFISLDTYPQSRKRSSFGNMAETEARPIPPLDSYQGEARFPQETFPASPSVQNRDPGTPPRLYSQFPDTYSTSRSPEFYQGQQYYPPEEGVMRGNFQGGYNPPDQVTPYSYMPNAMQQPNDGFMIDTILRARNEEDELSNVSGIVQYITQQ